MTSKPYRLPGALDRLKKNQIEIKEIQALMRNRNTPRAVAATAFSGVSAAGDAGGTGNFLPLSGGPISGPFALSPPVDFRIEIDVNNTIDIGESSSNSQHASNIQLDDFQPNSSVLDIIKGAAFNGQILIVKTFAPTTPYTIRQGTLANGGNIQTLDGNNFVAGDLKTFSLIFDETLKIEANLGGSWRVWTDGDVGGGGGGGFSDPLTQLLITLNTVTLPATTTINTNIATEFQITLDENIEFDFTGGPASGRDQVLTIFILQDGTGGFTIDWGAKVTNPPTIGLSPNESTTVVLVSRDQGASWIIESATAGGGGSTLPVPDTVSIVRGSADATKQMRFEIDGFSPATTRVMTLPNADVTLAGLQVTSQTFTGSNLFLNATFRDGLFFIQDTDDITRQLKFNLGGITSGQTRTLTVPNASVTIAGLEVTSQTFTGENIFLNAKVRTDTFRIQNTADPTKEISFSLGGATTGKLMAIVSNHSDDRILTLPDTTTDLAGLGVLSQTWTGTNIFAGITNVVDTNFSIKDNADASKIAKFDAGLITTATTRTFILPDMDTILGGLAVLSQDWLGTNLFSGGATVRDGNFFIQDSSDITKQVKFDAASISTGTVRTFTLPDASVTIAGLSVVLQSWTGTNDFFGITKVKTDSSFLMQDLTTPTKEVKWDLSGISPSTVRTITMPDGDITLGSGISPLTTKGDIFTFDTADARLPVGSNGQVLTANSAVALGVEWAAGGGTSNQIIQGDSSIIITDLGVGSISVTVDATEYMSFGGNAIVLTQNTALQGFTDIQGNVDLGNAITDTISFEGRVDSDIIPDIDSFRLLGDSTHYFASVFFDVLNINNGAGTVRADANGLEIRANLTGDSIELQTEGQNTRARFENGSIEFFEPLTVNDDIIIDNGSIIKAQTTQEIGFSVTDENTSPGTRGTLQMPRTDDTTPTAAELDTEFGSALGDHGLATLGGLPATPLFVIKVGTSPSTWRGIILLASGNTQSLEFT